MPALCQRHSPPLKQQPLQTHLPFLSCGPVLVRLVCCMHSSAVLLKVLFQTTRGKSGASDWRTVHKVVSESGDADAALLVPVHTHPSVTVMRGCAARLRALHLALSCIQHPALPMHALTCEQ